MNRRGGEGRGAGTIGGVWEMLDQHFLEPFVYSGLPHVKLSDSFCPFSDQRQKLFRCLAVFIWRRGGKGVSAAFNVHSSSTDECGGGGRTFVREDMKHKAHIM